MISQKKYSAAWTFLSKLISYFHFVYIPFSSPLLFGIAWDRMYWPLGRAFHRKRLDNILKIVSDFDLWSVCLWNFFLCNALSMKCLIYEMSYLRMSYLWNFRPWNVFLLNTPHEKVFLWNIPTMQKWNVLSLNCLSMKCLIAYENMYILQCTMYMYERKEKVMIKSLSIDLLWALCKWESWNIMSPHLNYHDICSDYGKTSNILNWSETKIFNLWK